MRLIDADTLDKDMTIRAVNDRDNTRRTWARAIGAVHDAPTIDPVRHARWKRDDDGLPRCTECAKRPLLHGSENYVLSEYCPACGAKMDEEGT